MPGISQIKNIIKNTKKERGKPLTIITFMKNQIKFMLEHDMTCLLVGNSRPCREQKLNLLS